MDTGVLAEKKACRRFPKPAGGDLFGGNLTQHIPDPRTHLVHVKRGLCPACAYPRAESAACSECGKALPGRAKAMT